MYLGEDLKHSLFMRGHRLVKFTSFLSVYVLYGSVMLAQPHHHSSKQFASRAEINRSFVAINSVVVILNVFCGLLVIPAYEMMRL